MRISKLRSNIRNSKIKVKREMNKFICIPIEVLEEIINKLPFSEFGRVRGTCVQFRNAADNILIRKLVNSTRIFDAGPANVECIYSKIYYHLTRPYTRCGHRSTAAGVYLYLIDRYSHSPVKFPLLLSDYISKFFQCIDCQLGDPNTQRSRLLYLITVLGLLNNLSNSDRRIKQINSKKFKLNFIVNRPNCALVCTRRNWNTFVYPDDRNTIILYLAEIMESNMIETSLGKLWKNMFGQDAVFGNEATNAKRKNKKELAIIEFTISGSDKLLDFLRTAPGAGDWEELPNENFTVKDLAHKSDDLFCKALFI